MSEHKVDHRFAAFRHRSYRLFFSSRFLASFAQQVFTVAVGWQMYDVTNNPFYLGLIGLFQFLPSLLLVLVTGAVADRYNRRAIVSICMGIASLGTLALLIMTLTGTFAPMPVFAVMIIFGLERAFMAPATQSLAPNLVPKEDLPNAIAWNSSSWQAATILGPVAGGLLYGLGPVVAYSTALVFLLLASVLVAIMEKPPQRIAEQKKQTWESITAGFKYIRSEKIVLGAISLDLFAVLLGGAVALMPVFARDILVLGPLGLGLLRAAPGIGAIVMAMLLAAFPIRHYAGVLMFIGVALFGASTVVFGLSETAWISILSLVVMGASDMISVYVRESLIALWTPDEVRGRVSAVNMVFIGASNELGEFRAGTMAAWVGTVPAVVIGGFGTLAVAVIWAASFPKLRQIDNLDAPEELQHARQ